MGKKVTFILPRHILRSKIPPLEFLKDIVLDPPVSAKKRVDQYCVELASKLYAIVFDVVNEGLDLPFYPFVFYEQACWL